jgi:hypothetical protein
MILLSKEDMPHVINEFKMKSLIFILLLLASCTKKQSAENVLSAFIKYRFKPFQERPMLKAMTTGALNQKINDMDEETFKIFTSTKEFKIRKYKVILSKCSKDSCFLTYTLSYDESDVRGRKYETEIKKIAELQKIDERWKIADVTNIKTFIDAKRPINTNK